MPALVSDFIRWAELKGYAQGLSTAPGRASGLLQSRLTTKKKDLTRLICKLQNHSEPEEGLYEV